MVGLRIEVLTVTVCYTLRVITTFITTFIDEFVSYVSSLFRVAYKKKSLKTYRLYRQLIVS